MDSLRIYKNDFESIVIEWRGKDVGYITIGKKYFNVNVHLTEYIIKKSDKHRIKEYLTSLLKHIEYENYSIVQLEKRGKKVIG